MLFRSPNPDLSDPQPLPQKPKTHLEALATTRLAFNETLWTLPPPLHNLSPTEHHQDEEDDIEVDDEGPEEEEEEEEEEINVT